MICEYDENKHFKSVSFNNNKNKFIFTFSPPKKLNDGISQFVFKNNYYFGLYNATNNNIVINGKNYTLKESLDLLDVLIDYCI